MECVREYDKGDHSDWPKHLIETLKHNVQAGFAASFVSKLSDTVSSEIGKVGSVFKLAIEIPKRYNLPGLLPLHVLTSKTTADGCGW